MNAFMVNKVIGSKVMNLQGEALGKIDNLVVDVDTGRILYAILESGGFLGMGAKLFPVPWASLAALPLEGTFFLKQTKDQLVNHLHGAPLRLRVENQLGCKMVKWIQAIEVVESVQLIHQGEGGYAEDHEYFGELANI